MERMLDASDERRALRELTVQERKAEIKHELDVLDALEKTMHTFLQQLQLEEVALETVVSMEHQQRTA
eukprot:gene3097-5867_t